MAGVTASWRPLGHGRTGQETKERPGGDSRLAARGTRRHFRHRVMAHTRGASWVAASDAGDPPSPQPCSPRRASSSPSTSSASRPTVPRYHREPGGSSRVAVRGREADLPGDREERNRECHFGRRRGDDDGHDGSTFTTGSALPVFRFVPLTTTGLSSDAIGGVKPVRSNVTRIGPASPWRHAAGPSPPMLGCRRCAGRTRAAE